MTERESEDLYRELQRKLAEYGSAPSRDLWADIARQLPPQQPIQQPTQQATPARPFLRARRRRAVAALLLGLVLVGLLWRPAQLWRPPTSTAVTTAGPAARLPQPTSDPAAPAGATARPASKKPSVAALNAAPGVAAQPQAAVPGHTAAPPATPGETAPAASQPGSGAPGPTASAGLPGRARAVVAGVAQAPWATPASPARKATRTVPGLGRAGLPPLPTAGRPVAGHPALAGATADAEPTAARNLPVGDAPEAATRPEAASTARLLLSRPSRLGLADRLALRRPAADELARNLPWPLPLPDMPDQKQAQPNRWAVQVLAGPALSYRRLSSSDPAVAGLARLERPAVAFAGQVQVRYTLAPHLQLSGGVGYAEYAARYSLRLPQAHADTVSDSQPTYRLQQQRDVYRYLTLPVQLHYQLGRHRRLGYGLTLGGTLDWYQGGRSTDCQCGQQTTWGRRGSPYRQLGLSATAGLELRYALTPGLTLLAQPTVRYSLFSVSAVPAVPGRYPFAAGLLTGISFDLR